MQTSSSPSALLAFPQRPDDRLRLALRRLEAALAEQAAAVAGFRASVADLSTAVSGLRDGLNDYGAALAATSDEVARARATASALEATADRMLRLG